VWENDEMSDFVIKRAHGEKEEEEEVAPRSDPSNARMAGDEVCAKKRLETKF